MTMLKSLSRGVLALGAVAAMGVAMINSASADAGADPVDYGANMFDNFDVSDMMQNPKIQEMMKDPEAIMQNPMFQQMLKDPSMMQNMLKGLGGGDGETGMPDFASMMKNLQKFMPKKKKSGKKQKRVRKKRELKEEL